MRPWASSLNWLCAKSVFEGKVVKYLMLENVTFYLDLHQTQTVIGSHHFIISSREILEQSRSILKRNEKQWEQFFLYAFKKYW